MDKLRFGTAGIPHSTNLTSFINPNFKSGTLAGIEQVKKLGLENMELEFVRSVNISEKLAKEVKKTAQKNDIELTAHGQYFINLNSQEPEKIIASKKRIFNAAKISFLSGAKSMTFHAAYYMKQDPEKVYQLVKSGMKEVIDFLQDENYPIILRPETTGKATQWGSIKEIIRLSEELEHVLPCIDFSHLHARTAGMNNTLEEFRKILSLVENQLGRFALNNMHIHLSGIEYSDKGERRHLQLEESDMNYLDLLKVWKEFKIKGVVVSESPNIEIDALLLQKTWRKL